MTMTSRARSFLRIMFVHARKVTAVTVTLLAVIGLPGCGGSDGPTAPQLAQRYASAPEFTQQWGLAAIDAHQAYGRLAARHGEDVRPGDGAVIAMVDTFAFTRHWEFDQSRIFELRIPGVWVNRDSGSWVHGTSTASVIGAVSSATVPPTVADFNFHGVAWGSELRVYGIVLGSATPGQAYSPITLSGLASANNYYRSVYRGVLQGEPDVLNLSFGYSGLIDNYSETDLRASLPDVIQELAQADRDEKTVIVISAGNAQGAACNAGDLNCVGTDPDHTENGIDAVSVQVAAGLPVRIAELRSHMVAAVAVNENRELATFSNGCGVAAPWCLAAPGENVFAALADYDATQQRFSQGYRVGAGTSYAAPFISGSLAVLKHWFRNQLPNQDLLTRLYDTADVTPDSVDDHGGSCPDHLDTDSDPTSCELSSTLGRGIIDLGAATAPIGETTMQLADGRVIRGGALSASRVTAGAPLGDGLAHGVAGKEVALFDEQGAPFWMPLGQLTSAQGSDSAEWLRSELWAAPSSMAVGARSGFAPIRGVSLQPNHHGPKLSFAVRGADAPSAVSHFDLAYRSSFVTYSQGRLATTALVAEGGDAPAAGLALTWSAAPWPITLRGGALRERGTAFGTVGDGVFSEWSATTLFTGVAAQMELGDWHLSATAELGSSSTATGSGLLTPVGPWRSSMFALEVARALGDRQRVRVSVVQPLRVERGRARLVAPVGRTKDGDTLWESSHTDMAPSGRRLDAGLDWQLRLDAGTTMQLGTRLTRHPGHDSTADAEVSTYATWRVEF